MSSPLSTGPLDSNGVAPRAAEGAADFAGGFPPVSRAVGIAAAVLGIAFFWAYAPTWGGLATVWVREADYSHGFLIVPLAALFLWMRRDQFPGLPSGVCWSGLGLLLLSVLIRFVGAKFYYGLQSLDGWSIIVWVAGIVLLFGGWRVLWWAAPAVVFLVFMVPLPFRIEHALSFRLQRVAAMLSSWILQFLGQPAFAEKTFVVVGGQRLEIEQACSGLRIFMGVVAMAFAYAILVRRGWWERALLLASLVPVALLANAARIVVTGLAYSHTTNEGLRKFWHDAAGYAMIPLAALLFLLVLGYLRLLIREVEVAEVGRMLRRGQGPA